ncbi:hypothetical protein GMOD_00009261 [Pyrenophora seminiperda CCB06]|uniref:Uncharacterized protein n=1 Tax=Pyrenophora seminiperda CCB06 TaxID=1302712 RepID=A0A3M7MC20_9PLEO|nr:hypothetical protein GMOD_00009261 [Pyrenophora seminiperda CCB06]
MEFLYALHRAIRDYVALANSKNDTAYVKKGRIKAKQYSAKFYCTYCTFKEALKIA